MGRLIGGFVLLTILLISVACNAKANNELNKLSDIGSGWNKLAVDLVFDNKKYAYQLIKLVKGVGNTSEKYGGELHKGLVSQLKPVLNSIKPNAFSAAFEDIYQGMSTGQFDEHEFTGFEFELDDNPATVEWLVAFQFNACSNSNSGEALAITCGDEQLHSWLIQLQGDGKYHLLMEADGLMDISKDMASQGYKLVTIHAFNEHNYLSNPEGIPEIGHPPCGSGEIEWSYQDGKYQPFKFTSVKGSCDLRFMGDTETIKAFSERTEAGIRRYLLEWLEDLTSRKWPQFQ